MKLWIDSTQPAPEGYVWVTTINEAKMILTCVNRMHDIIHTKNLPTIELIDMGHSAGDYIKLLDWLEENNYNYPIYNHSTT